MEEKLNQLSFANAALFGLLIAISYYLFFYHANNPEVQLAAFDQEMGTVKGEIAKLDRQIKQKLALKTEIENMKSSVSKIYENLSEDITVNEALATISKEARVAGLSIESITASSDWRKKETLAAVDMNVVLRGSFSQVMIFLSELTRDNKVYTVSSFNIDTEANSSDKSSGAVRFRSTMVAYRKLSGSEIESNNKAGVR